MPAFRLLLERWLEEGRNIGVAVARASGAYDDYGVDVFAAAVDEFIARDLVDPSALVALCDHIHRTRRPRPAPAAAPQHVDDRDVTPHDLVRPIIYSRRRRRQTLRFAAVEEHRTRTYSAACAISAEVTRVIDRNGFTGSLLILEETP